jgi:YfiH family protein
MLMTHNVPELILPDWDAPPRIGACFTTRLGGLSQPPYDSLNLGLNCGDQATTVEQNRLLLSQSLHLEHPPVWLIQVHGRRCLELPCADNDLRADAAWTRQPGLCCAILTADCLPILVTDINGTLVAAIHAGWRGLAAGVIASCIDQLPVPAEHLMACLGPAISAANYEVDSRVFAALTQGRSDAEQFFEAQRTGHWLADLPGLARQQLEDLGLYRISGGHNCTAADPHQFFSYRRDHQTGRMAALVWIK